MMCHLSLIVYSHRLTCKEQTRLGNILIRRLYEFRALSSLLLPALTKTGYMSLDNIFILTA